MLLAASARRTGIAEKLAAVIPDRRDPTRVVHPLPEILLARILAIACGYADADDLDSLRADPAFKLACGRLPESGADLLSHPTVSRWESAPGLRDLVRLGIPGGWCDGRRRPASLSRSSDRQTRSGHQMALRCCVAVVWSVVERTFTWIVKNRRFAGDYEQPPSPKPPSPITATATLIRSWP